MNKQLIKNRALEELPRSVFIFDENLQVEYFNRNFREVFGTSGECVTVGESLRCGTLELPGVCGKEKRCLTCHLRDVLTKCVVSGREICRKNIVRDIVTPFGKKDYNLDVVVRPIGGGHFLCMIEDITETVQALDDERRQNTILFKDLQKAKNIQSSFLPDRKGIAGMCEFDYIYRQMFQVGGDFFDVYPIDDQCFGAYIADVSGAGMSGGMLTVFLRDNYDKQIKSPALALSLLNHKFNELKIAEESYITMFALVVDTATHRITYCNAGHNQPLFVRSGTTVHEIFEEGKPVCNWYEDLSYDDRYIGFERGDMLALFTDGISETQGALGDRYGEERVRSVLRRGETIANTLESVQKDLILFNDGKESNDDLTLLLLNCIK